MALHRRYENLVTLLNLLGFEKIMSEELFNVILLLGLIAIMLIVFKILL